MGLSLTKAAQWTTASSGTGKLEFTPMNESLLKEILRFVERFSSQHPQEAEHVFEEPLQWRTTLVASDFKTDYDISDSAVQSHEKDSEGLPLLQLSPPAVYVRSFSQLSKLVHLADGKKLEEVRACLEVYVKKRIMFRKVTMNESVVLFCFAFLRFHCRKVSLDPAAAKNEVELLKQLCSDGEKRVLKSLRYTSEFEFSNGCRTPLWRQVHGEICYLVIEPCDAETLYITYSTAGVFLNEVRLGRRESGYERTSDVYADLVTLLKSRSPHFQDFAAQELPSTHKIQHVESVDGEEQGQPQRSYEQQEKNVHEKAKQQHTVNKAGGRNKNEMCPRWSSFALLSTFGYVTIPLVRCVLKYCHTASYCCVICSFSFRKTSAGAMPGELTSESSTESEEEEEQPERRLEGDIDRLPEYWQIQKLFRYLKAGNQTTTALTLCAMMDLNLMQETCQLIIRDLGGLEILLNLLDTIEVRCKIGSLKILRKISHNVQISRTIVYTSGLQKIVTILDLPDKDLKALAAETIANVARFRRARRTVRKLNGIKKLVKLLDCVPNLAKLTENQEKDVEVARCGVLALWSCSKSRKNKEAIRKAGGIPLLGRLLKSPHANMLIPVVGTLQECASEESCRIAIQTKGMIKDLVKNLRSDNEELQMHCASAIFKCAEEEQTRDLVRKYKGLQQLVSLLGKADNKQLLAAATGAIWKCSISTENVAEFQKYNVLQTLVGLLTYQPDEVLVNVVGALGEFAQIPANKATIGKCGGIKPLVNLLTGTDQALLVNVTKAVGACATDKDNMTIIQQLDGVRLVWSLLKNPSPDVQSSAAWALCPCIENAKDAGEMVRSLVGGLTLILYLLKSTNNEVLASICAAITKIARDEDNLAVITDLGVIPLLTKLTDTTLPRVSCRACSIHYCCMWGSNRESFGKVGAVAPLVRFLKSKDAAVHLSTAKALYQLSWDPNNVIIMHATKVVKVSLSVVAAAFLTH
uniref:Armadillo repeat containing 4 n=1 Tax=Stegastes partitus TaxID=144197 RepID=A0A3B5B5K6_9TELE